MEESDVIDRMLGTCSVHDPSLLELFGNDVDSIFATLQEAMEFEEIECRIVVSSMVREAITRGALRALAEESAEQLANKDLELCKTRDILKDKDAMIAMLRRDLSSKQQELDVQCEESNMQRHRQVLDLLHEREQFQEKLRESEALVTENNKKLTRMAENIVEMASVLDTESKRATMLEKQLKETRDTDLVKSRQISGLYAEIGRMKGEQHFSYARLKRHSRPKELKFNENMYCVAEEEEKHINQLERLLLEKNNQVTDLQKMLSEKDKRIHNLEKEIARYAVAFQVIESKEANLREESRVLSDKNSSSPQGEQDNFVLKERFEEQTFLPEAERGLLIGFLEGQVLEMAGELEQLRQLLEESTMQCKKLEERSVLQDLKSSLEGILEDMERTLSSQKELVEKKRGTLGDKNELLGKVDAELSYLKGKINEMSSFPSWQKEIFSFVQEGMNEQTWRFEAESDILSTYWQSLINEIQAENTSLCRELGDTTQMLSSQAEARGVTSFIKEKTSLALHANNSQTEFWKVKSEHYLAQIVDLERRLEDLTTDLEGRLAIQDAEILCLVESLQESWWKNDVEVLLILGITESLSREVTEELSFCRQQMGLKDEDFFCLALEADHLKQVLEDLENDFCASKSIYTMPMTDNSSIGIETKAGVLQSRFDPALQKNSDLEQVQDGEMATSLEVGELLKSRRMILEELEKKKSSVLQMMEKLAGKKLRHELEMDISAQILEQKYQEVLECVMASKFTIDEINSEVALQGRGASILDKNMQIKNIEVTGLRNDLKTSRRCLKEVKMQLESVIYRSSQKLEKLESGCSTVMAKCENVETLIESFSNQVKDMKKRILVLEEEIEQREWRHANEDEISVLVLTESLKEMQRDLEAPEIHRQDTDFSGRSTQRNKGISASSPVECCWKINKEQNKQGVLMETMESPVGNSNKDELISLLKREVTELRRENEQMLELKTEEIYKLKREFWKATEKQRSGLSSSRGKEGEGLSKWLSEGSTWLEHMCKEAGMMENDTVAFKLREEWQNEKVGLLQNISLKDRDVKELMAKVRDLTELDRSHRTMTSNLSARVAELEGEREQLMIRLREKQHSVSKLREGWQTEKEDLLETIVKRDRSITELTEELAVVLEKEKNHAVIESQVLAHIKVLESEKLHLVAEHRKASFSDLQLREELQAEKAALQELFSQKERDFTELARRESELVVHISKLESEKLQLLAELHKESSTELAKRESGLLANIEKPENDREQLLTEPRNESFTQPNLRHEWQIEMAGLLETVSQKESYAREVSEKFKELLEREKNHVITEAKLLAHIADLETEKEQLIVSRSNKESLALSALREKEEALALATRDTKEEEERQSILEKEIRDLRDKVKKSNQVVEALSRQETVVQGPIQLRFTEQTSQFVEALQKSESKITQKMQEKLARLDGTRDQLLMLNRHVNHISARESRYKEKLAREVNNLQKAEAEVDLLGDEVDILVDLLEKVYVALDIYAPVLQHCPEITDIAKAISQELQLRIDPR